jgi:cytochrome c peroxidase
MVPVIGIAASLYGSKSDLASQVQDPTPLSLTTSTARIEKVGRALFYDTTLSDPPGMACASCHNREAGYSYPNSAINYFFGTVPGAVAGRFGNRRPPAISYAPYLTAGPPHFDKDVNAWVGGVFWDGRSKDTADQVRFPLFNANEMNNHFGKNGSAENFIAKLKRGPTAPLLREAFGQDIFLKPADQVFSLVGTSLSSFERSAEVSPFSSKYDAYLAGKAKLTPDELLGMRFFTGTINGRPSGIPFKRSAHCMDCHALSSDLGKSPDLFTSSCFANLGVPKNAANPFYKQTDAKRDPAGCNPAGSAYVDLGLGAALYTSSPDLMWMMESDPFRINGTFKAPCLRNVDRRPYPDFVKAYMHNGVFKSLKEVVHFYNTRNLTSYPGEVIDFTAKQPYAHLRGRPLWAPPEFLNPNTLINPGGISGIHGHTSTHSRTMDLDAAQIGNLRLTDSQEDAIVAFLRTLSDGYTPGG